MVIPLGPRGDTAGERDGRLRAPGDLDVLASADETAWLAETKDLPLY
mgnify:CR=1 FL=1